MDIDSLCQTVVDRERPNSLSITTYYVVVFLSHSLSFLQANEVVGVCEVIKDGSVFDVGIDEFERVWHLKNIIKEMKLYNFPADQLTLYVEKKDGEWLKSDDPDVLQLEDGETPHGITALMNKMNPTFCIGNAAFGFPGEDDAGEDEIHILVDVPQDVNPSGPRYYRNPSFLFMAWVFCNIFTIGEWFIIQEGRKVALWECVNEILLRVSLFVMTAFLAWNWYWEARSEEEQSEEEQSCLHLGYGSIV